MSRRLIIVVAGLGLAAVLGIVGAQERPAQVPVLQAPVLPRDGGVPSRWRSAEAKGTERRIDDRLTSPAGAVDPTDDEESRAASGDGLKSVLKRRSVEPESTASDGGPETAAERDADRSDKEQGARDAGSSRRPSMEPVAEPALSSPAPAETARKPAARPIAPRGIAPSGPAPGSVAESLSLRGQSARVRVEVVGPAAISFGKPAAYRIAAVNESTESAGEVVVAVAVPGHVAVDGMAASAGEARGAAPTGGSIEWRIPALAGGAREQLELQITANSDQPAGISVTWTMRSPELTASIPVLKPALDVQVGGPEDILYGTRQIYTITVSNPGTGPAENVSLDVSTGGNGQARRIGTLAAGAREQIRMELVARESGSLEIKATAHGDGLRDEAARTVLVRRAELAVEIRGPGLKFAGSTGTYEVAIQNTGNASASDVEVSVKLPAGSRYVGGVENASETAGRLAWKVKEIAPNDARKVAIEVAFEKAGDLQCEVITTMAGELASTASCPTKVEALADLQLQVNDPQGPKTVGEEVVFEIRVVNRGTKAAQNVHVVGQFSDGVEPIRAEGSPAELVPGQVLFRDLPRVEAGQQVVLRIVAKAESAGNHRFRAVVKCEDPDTELTAEDMTRFFGDEPVETARSGGATRR